MNAGSAIDLIMLDAGPAAIVGSSADDVARAARERGLRVVRLDHAFAPVEPAERAGIHPPVDTVLIEGCERAHGEDAETAILDAAFDGHPSIPRNAMVIMHFAAPCELSEALADDAVPCAFHGIDETAGPDTLRLAA